MIFSARDGFVLEHLGAPAIIGQRHQRAQRRQIAHVGAEIAFEAPERGDHRRRHAVFLFRARERGLVGPDALLALLHAIDRCHPAGELGKHLAKHALAAVAVDDALVVDHAGRRFGERALRHPGRDRLLLQLGQEAVERHAVMASRATAQHGRRRCFGRGGNLPGRNGRPYRRREGLLRNCYR